MRKMLPVRFDESELELLRAAAAHEGRSLQDYVHDTLMDGLSARSRRRDEVTRHVLEVSEELNARLAQ